VFVEPVQGEGGFTGGPGVFCARCATPATRSARCWSSTRFSGGVGPNRHAVGLRAGLASCRICWTAAKAWGAGYHRQRPVTDRVAPCWSRAITAATFAGGPVVCRAALAVLAHIDAPAFLAHVRENGRACWSNAWARSNPATFREVRGLGLYDRGRAGHRGCAAYRRRVSRGVSCLTPGRTCCACCRADRRARITLSGSSARLTPCCGRSTPYDHPPRAPS